jgi:hypothetical protein
MREKSDLVAIRSRTWSLSQIRKLRDLHLSVASPCLSGPASCPILYNFYVTSFLAFCLLPGADLELEPCAIPDRNVLSSRHF